MENDSPGIPEGSEEPPQPTQPQGRGFRRFVRRWVARPSRSTWCVITAFSQLAWRGFAFGSAAVLLLFAAYLAWFMRTGLWRWLDVVLGALVTAIVLALTGLLLLLLRHLLKAWPAWFIVTVPGPLIFLIVLFGGATEHPAFPLLFFATIILLAGSLGGSISVFQRAKTSGASRGHWIAATIWLAATVAAIGALTYWLAGGGSDPYVELQETVPAQSGRARRQAPNGANGAARDVSGPTRITSLSQTPSFGCSGLPAGKRIDWSRVTGSSPSGSSRKVWAALVSKLPGRTLGWSGGAIWPNLHRCCSSSRIQELAAEGVLRRATGRTGEPWNTLHWSA
jgi:hypothetical protein